MSGSRCQILLIGLGALLLAGPAGAQSELGTQRVGTSSGTFLKIPIDARTSAMAGALSANATGPAAMFSNPAALGLEKERATQFTSIQYVADIPMYGAAASLPLYALKGSLGFSFSGVFVKMDETDEYHPLGTGRDFSYSTWCVALGFSRALTDKLSFGIAGKALHEAFATELGGPSMTPWLIDVGTVYYVGYRDARIGLAVNNFGPDLRPDGYFRSHRNGTEIRYGSFSPPTVFRFGFSIDPYRSESIVTLASFDVGHMADNKESLRLGLEAVLRKTLALRGGYDFTADALNLHAGFGLLVRIPTGPLQLDYAFSDGDYFGNVHRWTLTVPW